ERQRDEQLDAGHAALGLQLEPAHRLAGDGTRVDQHQARRGSLSEPAAAGAIVIIAGSSSSGSISARSRTAFSLSALLRAIRKSCLFGAAAAAVSSSTSPSTTSSMSAVVIVCIWKNAPSAIASGT